MQTQRRQRFTARMFPAALRTSFPEVRRASGWDRGRQSNWQARRKWLNSHLCGGQIIAQTEALNFAMARLARQIWSNLSMMIAHAIDRRNRIVRAMSAVQASKAT